jgi:hypothetical protein
VNTIITQFGQAGQDPPGAGSADVLAAGGHAPGKCGKFIQLMPTAPNHTDAVCARCWRPDFVHEADGRERQARLADLEADRLAMALTWIPQPGNGYVARGFRDEDQEQRTSELADLILADPRF